jgi:radical SAM protein with 4Fe4S-binding SPASM domain
MPEHGPLRYAVIEITNRCNLRCPHCASTSGHAREDELSLDEIRALLATIERLGGEEITIIGGEAFLRDDWYEVCAAVNELSMRLILISNGLLIRSDDVLAKLRGLRPHLIGISIDGATRESYRALRGVDGFDHCVALVKRLRDDGHAEVNAITTVMKANLREFDAFAGLFDGTGITWQVQIANRGGERFGREHFISRDEYAWLARKMRDVFVDRPGVRLRHMDDFGYFPLDPKLRFLHETWHGCVAGVELIGVRSNGDVLGCLSLGDDFVEGNLRREALESIWESGRYFSRFRSKEELLGGECATCAYARECRAGCTCIAYSATGDIGSNPYCIRSLETQDVLGDLALGGETSA